VGWFQLIDIDMAILRFHMASWIIFFSLKSTLISLTSQCCEYSLVQLLSLLRWTEPGSKFVWCLSCPMTLFRVFFHLCSLMLWCYHLSCSQLKDYIFSAFYASCIAANVVEQLWNFAWPSAIALIHPSLLPVAVMGFFTKVTTIVGGPLVGKVMDHFPRMHAYNCLTVVQASCLMIYKIKEDIALLLKGINLSIFFRQQLSYYLRQWLFAPILCDILHCLICFCVRGFSHWFQLGLSRGCVV